jgi:uracil-DNA glycosylase
MLTQQLSPWKQFVVRWKNCSQCKLCEARKNVVLARGNVPADILFIGEAPGQSEDVLGQPFVGPAGKLLDRQIAEAFGNCPGLDLRLCFTNLVCCIPKDETNKKVGEPDKGSIEACEQRLIEFVKLCRPKLVVAVGDLADKYLFGAEVASQLSPVPDRAKITHPAAILRAEIVRQSLMNQKVIVILENAFRDLV